MNREIAGDSAVQSLVLEDLRQAVNYRRWLATFATPHLGEEPIEIGSGAGDYAQEWASGCRVFTASEADPKRLRGLRERFASEPNVRVTALTAPVKTRANHTAVVAYNVLEHVAQDAEALRSFAGLTRPDGKVIILVPAFPVAMSQFDLEIGHHRRYRKRGLGRTAVAAGLVVEELRYINAPGLILWIILMRLLRQKPKAGAALRVYDRYWVPTVAQVEARISPPFGQSLFMVARAR